MVYRREEPRNYRVFRGGHHGQFLLNTIFDARKATDEAIRRLYDVLNALAVMLPSEGLTQPIQQLQAIEDRARSTTSAAASPAPTRSPSRSPNPTAATTSRTATATVK